MEFETTFRSYLGRCTVNFTPRRGQEQKLAQLKRLQIRLEMVKGDDTTQIYSLQI